MRERLRRSRALRAMVRWYRGRTTAYPDWQKLLGPDWEEWQGLVASGGAGPRILIPTSAGGYWAGTTFESLLGIALTLRGARVEYLLCDEVLAACQQCEIRAYSKPARFSQAGPQRHHCKSCFAPGEQFLTRLGFPVHRYGQFIGDHARQQAAQLSKDLALADIPLYSDQELRLGEQALAGTLRFFARGTLENEPQAEAVLRRYFRAALTTAYAIRGLLDKHAFDHATFHHGIYVPQGVVGAVCRERQLPISNWTAAYRKSSFIFSHGDSYHHTLLNEPESAWQGFDFGPDQKAELLSYLKSRWYGTDDWIWFHDRPLEDWSRICDQAGIQPTGIKVALLTNVIWDAQLHFSTNAFGSMMEWVIDTVRYFEKRSDIELVIRVHPAEIRGTLPSRQRVGDEIARLFGPLPTNVKLVGPESDVSTYALVEGCNAALIYGTKTGVELAAIGKPVVVAGEAWVRNKGFTFDASSREEYLELLDQVPYKPLDSRRVALAQRYAYHLFFRRMIPVEVVDGTGGDPPFRPRVGGLADLRPGACPGLDLICDGILNGAEFSYPAESAGWLAQATNP